VLPEYRRWNYSGVILASTNAVRKGGHRISGGTEHAARDNSYVARETAPDQASFVRWRRSEALFMQ
jgi:hypothetical protein